MNSLDWTVIVIYSVVLAGISLFHWRKLKKQDDIFLAGRSMSRWPVAISLYMALFSTNSFIGLTGWVNRENGTIWIMLQNIGIVAAVPFVVLLYPSLYCRLRISTAYEYLEQRFNYAVRAFASVFFLSARVMWMSTMLYAASLVISMVLGWTPERDVQNGQVIAIAILAALGTFFAFSGGMRAVIWTDVVQFVVLMGGVLTLACFTILDAGGVGEVIRIASSQGKFRPPELFSLTNDVSFLSVFLFGFFTYLSNAGSDQVIIQTYLSAKNEDEVRSSLWRNGFILKPVSIIFPMLGVLIFVYYFRHPEVAALMRIPDDALPLVVMNVLPAGIRGLVVAAITAAFMTSMSSGMAATSASVQIDFIRRWMKRPLSDTGAVMMGRLLILLFGALITAGALFVRVLGTENNIIQILNIVMYPFVGVLLGIVLLAILVHRANAAGTLFGAAAGFLTTIAFPLSEVVVLMLADAGVPLSSEITARISYLAEISNFFYVILGFLATVILGSFASLAFPPPPASKIMGRTRLSMPAKEPGERQLDSAERTKLP